jgi:hypothetical protein
MPLTRSKDGNPTNGCALGSRRGTGGGDVASLAAIDRTDRASHCGRSTTIMSGPTTLSRTAPMTDASIGCSTCSTSSPMNAWRSVSPASSCDRRSVRPLHPAGRSRSHPVRQRTGVRGQGRAGMDRSCRHQDRLYRAGQPNSLLKNLWKPSRRGCLTGFSECY